MNRQRANNQRPQNIDPFRRVNQMECDIHFRENNCNEFMVKIVKRLFPRAALLLSYEWLDVERLEEARQIYFHYFGNDSGEDDRGIAEDAVKQRLEEARQIYLHYFCFESDAGEDDRGIAEDAVKRALSKCRNYERQKIYNLRQRYVCITPQYQFFYYRRQRIPPYGLIPEADPDFEENDMGGGRNYYVDPLGNLRVPRIFGERQYLILIKKTRENITIFLLHPRRNRNFINEIFVRTLRNV
uniref:Uncharacterized protein n=1 Tax=Panagrolaimus sp. ES5 TaxID=591445 RepID=A0AC34GDK8_9BILA